MLKGTKRLSPNQKLYSEYLVNKSISITNESDDVQTIAFDKFSGNEESKSYYNSLNQSFYKNLTSRFTDDFGWFIGTNDYGTGSRNPDNSVECVTTGSNRLPIPGVGPQYKNKFNDIGVLINLSSSLVNNTITPGTFVIEDNSNGTSKKIFIKDDKYGNLYASGSNYQVSQSTTSISSSQNYVGNIFYQDGIVVITETGSYYGTWDLISANHETISPAMTDENNLPYGFFFKPDGTKYWMIGAEGSKEGVYEYGLSTAWDASTAAYTGNSIDYSGLGNSYDAFTDVHFAYDGTKMYTLNKDTDYIVEYPLTTAWDITTATDTTTQSFYVNKTDANPQGFYFRNDGLKVYMNGIGNHKTYEMNMSTAWDITSITDTSQSFATSESLDAHEDLLNGITFYPDGNRMYTTGNRQNMVYEHRLSTAWDITTAAYHTSKSVIDDETNVQGIQWKPDGSKMYIVGFGGDRVRQYDITSASFWNDSGIADQTNYTASYQMERNIRTMEWTCIVEPDEMNFSMNPTIMPSGSWTLKEVDDSRKFSPWITGSFREKAYTSHSIISIDYKTEIPKKFRSKNFSPYITKIGLYNDKYELICVAALPIPVKKSKKQRMIFKIQIDF